MPDPTATRFILTRAEQDHITAQLKLKYPTRYSIVVIGEPTQRNSDGYWRIGTLAYLGKFAKQPRDLAAWLHPGTGELKISQDDAPTISWKEYRALHRSEPVQVASRPALPPSSPSQETTTMPRFVADLDLTQIMTSARERVAQLAPSGVKLISKKSTVAIFRTDRDKQAMGLVGTFSIADHPDEAWEVRWNEIMDMRVIRKKRSSLK